MTDAMLWRRLDLPGHEIGRVVPRDAGWELSGTAVCAPEHRPCRLDYFVVCDAGWRTHAAHVSGVIGERASALRVSVDAEQRWRVNGAECPAVAGCLGIDLGFSPSTNLLPIRRLALPVGEAAEVKAAWLPFPALVFEVLPQVSRREGERTYRYESGGGRFVRLLEVNAVGVVTNYPGLWQAEAATEQGDAPDGLRPQVIARAFAQHRGVTAHSDIAMVYRKATFPLALRLLLSIAAIYMALVGLGFLFAPQAIGIGAVPTDAAAALIASLRLFGSPFLGIAVLNWTARNAEPSTARNAIVLGNMVGFGAIAALDGWGVGSGARPLTKGFALMHLLFAVACIWGGRVSLAANPREAMRFRCRLGPRSGLCISLPRQCPGSRAAQGGLPRASSRQAAPAAEAPRSAE